MKWLVIASVALVVLGGPVFLSNDPQGGWPGISAQAAKKKKKLSEAELTKALEPVTKDLTELSAKIKSRRLLSPEENGKLMAAYDTLSTLSEQTKAGNVALVTPFYQVGLLLKAREQWLEAYDALSYVTENYANSPYATRANRYLIQLRPKVQDVLPPEPTLQTGPAPAAASAAPASAPPATTATAPAKKPAPAKP